MASSKSSNSDGSSHGEEESRSPNRFDSPTIMRRERSFSAGMRDRSPPVIPPSGLGRDRSPKSRDRSPPLLRDRSPSNVCLRDKSPGGGSLRDRSPPRRDRSPGARRGGASVQPQEEVEFWLEVQGKKHLLPFFHSKNVFTFDELVDIPSPEEFVNQLPLATVERPEFLSKLTNFQRSYKLVLQMKANEERGHPTEKEETSCKKHDKKRRGSKDRTSSMATVKHKKKEEKKKKKKKPFFSLR
mmetsp:Transcript_33169/g.51850  ORF Transcript_33169/g.51850 Transcript_33169/m.51850 type:complete len:242 (+) Transcript_33169:1175-1900(+)